MTIYYFMMHNKGANTIIGVHAQSEQHAKAALYKSYGFHISLSRLGNNDPELNERRQHNEKYGNDGS